MMKEPIPGSLTAVSGPSISGSGTPLSPLGMTPQVFPKSPSALDRQVGEGVYASPYRAFAIQPAEFCHKNGLSWCAANVVKYVTRYRNKNGLEDLRKAQHYLDMLIEFEYPNNKDDKKYG